MAEFRGFMEISRQMRRLRENPSLTTQNGRSLAWPAVGVRIGTEKNSPPFRRVTASASPRVGLR